MKTSKMGHFGTVSAKGWVVIPKEYRERLKLKKGSKVVIVEYGGRISISLPSKDPIADAAGRFADGPSLTAALLRDRAEEDERVDEKLGIKTHPGKEEPRKRLRS